jgi:aryl-alcohol dehydrogenase-like predicted oxidoreductase
MQRILLAPDYEISRVIRGGWQMASGHGAVRSDDPIADMVAFADAGITTFDCADIYTGVEEMIGEFRQRYRMLRGEAVLRALRVHTKFVPDLEMLSRVTRSYVEGVIDRSLQRLRTERLDLVQFHWWDYEVPGYLEAAGHLVDLQRAGKIDRIGATNFDTARMLALVESGVKLLTMQVQYSLLDNRAARRMAEMAARNDVSILCYGTVAGGFLGDRWLGVAEPAAGFENRSLTKYKLVIDDFGGWPLFQELLQTLRRIADRHASDIATVASAAMLRRPSVAAVIVGARNRTHLASNLAISGLVLSDADHAEIAGVLSRASELEGDVFELERDRNGRHGAIMKYNLNKGAA